jgi:hypothetical protein
MPEPTYLAMMDDSDLHSAFAAQDAAEALTALGWPVLPSDDSETWRIGYFVLTDEELIELAARRGSRSAAERVQ